MTDKELIKQEIERRIESMNSCPFKTAELGSEKFDEGELYAYKQILQFIDSLPEEPASEDLEEAAKHYLYGTILYDDVYVGNPTEEDCIRCFKAGAEWQKHKMMKYTVDAIFIQDYAYKKPVLYGDLKYKMNIVSGQPIKLCQIKEVQQ